MLKIRSIIILLLTAQVAIAQTTQVDTIGFAIQVTGDAAAIDNQSVYLNGDTLGIIRGNEVLLTAFLDNTDNQQITSATLDANNVLSLTIEGGNTATVDLSGLDLPGLTAQTLTLVGDQLSISDGNTASLSVYRQSLSDTRSGTNVTIGITGGTGTTFSVADNDNSPTNELYNDAAIYAKADSIKDAVESNDAEILQNALNILARIQIPATCASGQVVKYNGSSFTCQADAVTGAPDGYISDLTLSGNELIVTGVGNATNTNVTFSGWDSDASDDVVSSTVFGETGGDVTGTYDDLTVINNSHTHSASTITTNILSSIDGVVNDGGNVDFVAGSNITITPDNANNRITFSSTSQATNLSVSGTTSPVLNSSTGTNVSFVGVSGSGRTPVEFSNGSNTSIGAAVFETDPTVPSHVKSITSGNISTWNASNYIPHSTDDLNVGGYGNVTALRFNNGSLFKDLYLVDGNGFNWSASGTKGVALSYNESQQLALSGNSLSISGGNSITLPAATDTDDQTLSLSGNTLSIADGNSVSLASYLDNTDNQQLALSANNTLSLTGSSAVSLQHLYNVQSLSLTNNTLSLSNGGSVNLSPYLDNSDSQTLSLSGNNLSIAGGNTVSLPTFTNTDNQQLGLSGNTLSLTDGGSVSLASFANTDNQSLSSVLGFGSNASIGGNMFVTTGHTRFTSGGNWFGVNSLGPYFVNTNSSGSIGMTANGGVIYLQTNRQSLRLEGPYIRLEGDVNLVNNDLVGVRYLKSSAGVNIEAGLSGNSPAVGRVRINSSNWVEVNTGSMDVDVTGSLTASKTWTVSSDERLKDNIQELPYGIDQVLQMVPVQYNYKGKDGEHLGFIAQDVQRLLPEIVEQDDDGYLSLAYSEIIPVLIKAIQQQEARIRELEKHIKKE